MQPESDWRAAAHRTPLPRYVGASEENIRNLFKEAEVDYAKLGEASGVCFWHVC